MLPHTADTTGYNYCTHSETQKYLLEFSKENHLPCEHQTKKKVQLPVPKLMAHYSLHTTLNHCIAINASYVTVLHGIIAALQVFQDNKSMDEHSSEVQLKILNFYCALEITVIHCTQRTNGSRNSHLKLECLYLHFNSVHYQNKIS